MISSYDYYGQINQKTGKEDGSANQIRIAGFKLRSPRRTIGSHHHTQLIFNRHHSFFQFRFFVLRAFCVRYVIFQKRKQVHLEHMRRRAEESKWALEHVFKNHIVAEGDGKHWKEWEKKYFFELFSIFFEKFNYY